MSEQIDRDRVLAAEIFNGDSVNWYQQAFDVVLRARAEERSRICEKLQALVKELLDDGHSEPT